LIGDGYLGPNDELTQDCNNILATLLEILNECETARSGIAVGETVCTDAYDGSSMQFLQSEETDCDGTLAAAINDLLDEYLGPYEGGNSPHAAWMSCTDEGFLKITDDDEYGARCGLFVWVSALAFGALGREKAAILRRSQQQLL
jgi:hypothetical protein